MCADLSKFKLSRAAAASSAVPVVLSPITIDNYGGSCGYQAPAWLSFFANEKDPPRPAGRILNRLQELQEFDDASQDRYFHLIDGAVSDTPALVGMAEAYPLVGGAVAILLAFLYVAVIAAFFPWH